MVLRFRKLLPLMVFLLIGGWFGFFLMVGFMLREQPSPVENLLLAGLTDVWGLWAYLLASRSEDRIGCLASVGRRLRALLVWTVCHFVSIPLALGILHLFSASGAEPYLVQELGKDAYAAIVAIPMSAAYYFPQIPAIVWVSR